MFNEWFKFGVRCSDSQIKVFRALEPLLYLETNVKEQHSSFLYPEVKIDKMGAVGDIHWLKLSALLRDAEF